MTARISIIPVILILLLGCGCNYRFVDPFPASDYDLLSVRNATNEPGIAEMLEAELRLNGGFKDKSASRLSVSITRFEENVETVGSGGSPVRQKLLMEITWKIDTVGKEQADHGSKVLERTYPYSADLSTLDWNRRAALSLLAEIASRTLLEELGMRP